MNANQLCIPDMSKAPSPKNTRYNGVKTPGCHPGGEKISFERAVGKSNAGDHEFGQMDPEGSPNTAMASMVVQENELLQEEEEAASTTGAKTRSLTAFSKEECGSCLSAHRRRRYHADDDYSEESESEETQAEDEAETESTEKESESKPNKH